MIKLAIGIARQAMLAVVLMLRIDEIACAAAEQARQRCRNSTAAARDGGLKIDCNPFRTSCAL
jgi:hypothetical protein